MERVVIKDKEYYFIKDYKDDISLRKSFNQLTKKTYGFDFELWYQDGYWGSTYIPYSLVDSEQIVANVSVSIMDYLILGQRKRYIQLGTVMTDAEYRGQGLARYLIEKIIEEWKNNCDDIYLFANDRVLDFYPKFGFCTVKQYQYSKSITAANGTCTAEKLDMSLEANRNFLVEKIRHSVAISKLSMLDNIGLVMFYCTAFMKDTVYYLRAQDSIAIAEFERDTLYLQDVFSQSEIDLEQAILSLSNKEIKKVVLGFTPNNTEGYYVEVLKQEDTTLFSLQNQQDLFQNNALMFPILSHA